jgi:hypothetical protein
VPRRPEEPRLLLGGERIDAVRRILDRFVEDAADGRDHVLDQASTLALRDQLRDKHPDVLTTNLCEGFVAETRVHVKSQHPLVALDSALSESGKRGVGLEPLVGRLLEGDRLHQLIWRRGLPLLLSGTARFSRAEKDALGEGISQRTRGCRFLAL